MNHFFSFRRKKIYFISPKKNSVIQKQPVIYIRPRHTFQQGLLSRLANPAGCGCGK